MLDACAPGYTKRSSTHKWRVMFNRLTYPSLPLGKHGNRKNPEIRVGEVRHMLNHLGVDMDCAHKHLPGLGNT